MTKPKSCIGDRLRVARELRGWEVRELSRRSGVHPVQISRYENEHQIPSVETLAKLAFALKVSTDWLIGLIDGELIRNPDRRKPMGPTGRWQR